MQWKRKQAIEKICKAKSWLFENVNKINKPFQDDQLLLRGKQMISIRNEKEDITIDSNDIFKVIKEYYE